MCAKKKPDAKPPLSFLKSYPGPVRMSAAESDSPKDWELVICGDLTDQQQELLSALIAVPRFSRGTIFFDSCGGSAYVGLALASLIRFRGLKATAVVAGECSSAAIMPFAACPQRYVSRHSSLLFHPIRWSSEEQVRLEDASEWVRHFRQMEADQDGLLAQLFGCPEELLAAWHRPGRFVSGQEMVDAGLAKMIDLFSGDVWAQIRKLSTPPA